MNKMTNEMTNRYGIEFDEYFSIMVVDLKTSIGDKNHIVRKWHSEPPMNPSRGVKITVCSKCKKETRDYSAHTSYKDAKRLCDDMNASLFMEYAENYLYEKLMDDRAVSSWNPSRDIFHAFLIADKMIKNGFIFSLTSNGESWTAVFETGTLSKYMAKKEKASTAICMAAYKALISD